VNSGKKTANSIEMSFEMVGRVGATNDVLDGGSNPPREGAILGDKWAAQCNV